MPEPSSPAESLSRPRSLRPTTAGKFLALGGQRLFLKGVTYGPFRRADDGSEYHTPAVVEADFLRMRENGLNAVRLYTVPPRWLFDLAERHGLRALVGLPWEQHIAFLDERKRVRAIEARIRDGVRSCREHPGALLGYAVGNEIPASIGRWYGRRRVEEHLRRLYEAAKEEDPEGLVTYVNYPTTEYLQLPFLDFVSYNVYLESRERLEAYLARLQNLAGDRPLLMAELGLDSRRRGREEQAASLEWQVRSAFAGGCAGAFVFSWTDEWHRGGAEVEDWDFGLTDRQRRPKPALVAARRAFAEVPFPPGAAWPRVTVVVCTHNGERTIRECLEGVGRLSYPDYETLVIDDASTDGTAAIAREMGFRVLPAQGRGLSCARNTGLRAGTGEIVAYLDDDAYPDPHWLTYLVSTFQSSSHAGVGGPNLPPPGDGFLAECVANSPGGPSHVLLSDREAEHIPGCNMAFRRACLVAIGGFDPQFWVAGDDVDLCWRLQRHGWTLGFHPAAVVWHHRRDSVRGYWRQQRGYGRAEAMLERKWPEKYNAAGHVAWAGRLYGQGIAQRLGAWRGRIYQGSWGSAPFQSIYQPAPGVLSSLVLMPEWHLVIALLSLLSLLGLSWPPLLAGLVALIPAACAPLALSALLAVRAYFPGRRPWRLRARLCAVTALLHLLQPLARLAGRLRYGLTPWRRHGVDRFPFPIPRRLYIWSELWRAPDEWLRSLESALRTRCMVVVRGGDFDAWDLEARSGTLGAVRIFMAIEEHGGGRQLVRFRTRPRWSAHRVTFIALFALLAARSAMDPAPVATVVLGGTALALACRKLYECVLAMAAVARALQRVRQESEWADRVILDGAARRPALGVIGAGGRLLLPHDLPAEGAQRQPGGARRAAVNGALLWPIAGSDPEPALKGSDP